MIRPDLWEVAKAQPESVTTEESLILGLASMGTALDGIGSDQARQELMNNGMGMVTSSLRTIRTGSEFSERQRFALAAQVIRTVDFQSLSQLPQTAETVQLFAETMLTFAAGQQTQIRAKIDEHFEGVVGGFYRLSALMMLGDEKENLTAVGQLKHIENSDLHTPEQRREIAAVWGSHLATEGSEEQAVSVIDYFINKGDMETFSDITIALIKAGPRQQLG